MSGATPPTCQGADLAALRHLVATLRHDRHTEIAADVATAVSEIEHLRHELSTALRLLGDIDAADRLDDLVSITGPYTYGWWSTVGPLVAADRYPPTTEESP